MPRGTLGRQAVIEDTDETPAVDTDNEEGQFRSGEVSEGDFIESLARKAKWTPKEEWKRDPTKWVDAKTYLERLPNEIESLQERNRRTAQAAADALEDQRRVLRAEAEARVAAADTAEDRVAAARDLAAVSGPPPQTVAWMGQNQWFNDDPDARQMAVGVINRLAAQGVSIDEQLEAAAAQVKKRFPEHFGQAEPLRNEEVRLSETRRAAPPAVQAGTRGAGSGGSKEKGFGDVPPGDQALYRKHFERAFMGQGLTQDQAQAKYAASYWRNKG